MEQVEAAIWLRVSTGEQEAGNQLPELEQFATHHGYNVVKTYRLDGESAWHGGKEDGAYRKALARALKDAWQGQYKVLVVWALDRITREGAEGALRIIRQFRERGVTLVSVQESWLTGSLEVQQAPQEYPGARRARGVHHYAHGVSPLRRGRKSIR